MGWYEHMRYIPMRNGSSVRVVHRYLDPDYAAVPAPYVPDGIPELRTVEDHAVHIQMSGNGNGIHRIDETVFFHIANELKLNDI